MVESKYVKYVTEIEIRDGRHGQEIIYLGKDVGNANFSIFSLPPNTKNRRHMINS